MIAEQQLPLGDASSSRSSSWRGLSRGRDQLPLPAVGPARPGRRTSTSPTTSGALPARADGHRGPHGQLDPRGAERTSRSTVPATSSGSTRSSSCGSARARTAPTSSRTTSPQIEFDPPDFPWLFTPARAPADDRLRPWCVLVVVDLDVVDPPRTQPGSRCRCSRCRAQPSASELPDLAESWAWAHAQVVAPAGTGDAAAAALGRSGAERVAHRRPATAGARQALRGLPRAGVRRRRDARARRRART